MCAYLSAQLNLSQSLLEYFYLRPRPLLLQNITDPLHSLRPRPSSILYIPSGPGHHPFFTFPQAQAIIHSLHSLRPRPPSILYIPSGPDHHPFFTFPQAQATIHSLHSLRPRPSSILYIPLGPGHHPFFTFPQAQAITPSHYADVVEERNIEHLCGYPPCGTRMGPATAQKYHISLEKKQVYDLTEQKVEPRPLYPLKATPIHCWYRNSAICGVIRLQGSMQASCQMSPYGFNQ